MTARVFVTLKKAVLDPQGKAVQGALAKLGYPSALRRLDASFARDPSERSRPPHDEAMTPSRCRL